ncbi:MAG: ABC transporter ATP-binding protein [Eubacterium sp.]|nr:ABC transporter ATP-binding protein [Eubacterium sp.]
MTKRENISRWWDIITYGDSGKYARFIAWLFFDSFVASIPSSVLMVAVYFLLAPVLDSSRSYEQRPFWILFIILLLQTAVYAVVRRKSYLDICVGHVSAQQEEKLRLGDKLKTLSMGYFATHDAGELSTLLMRNYEEIENLSSSIVANGAVILIRLLIALVVLGIFNVKMMLAMFIVIPLAIPFAIISYNRVAHSSAELLKIQQETAERVIEYAGGITTLQAYNRTGSAFSALKDSFARMRDDSKSQEKAGGAVSMYGRAVLFMGISIVMGVGAHLISQGDITPFFYIMCLLAALQVYEPIMQLFVFVISMARINQCVDKLSRLKEEKALKVNEPARTTEHSDISFKNVHFAYNKNEEVIKGISFDIPERRFVALVGSSGSGKTTIARLLARFWDVSEGIISIGGVPITDMTQEHLLSKISMVFQDVYLFRGTIEENIKLGRPDATASLDPENEVLIQRAIDELVKNKTVLVIAHRLQSVMNADEIIVLDDGKILEQGDHIELLKKGGRYAALWEDQQKAGSWKIA